MKTEIIVEEHKSVHRWEKVLAHFFNKIFAEHSYHYNYLQEVISYLEKNVTENDYGVSTEVFFRSFFTVSFDKIPHFYGYRDGGFSLEGFMQSFLDTFPKYKIKYEEKMKEYFANEKIFFEYDWTNPFGPYYKLKTFLYKERCFTKQKLLSLAYSLHKGERCFDCGVHIRNKVLKLAIYFYPKSSMARDKELKDLLFGKSDDAKIKRRIISLEQQMKNISLKIEKLKDAAKLKEKKDD